MSDSSSDETDSLREEIKRLRKSLSDLTLSLDAALRMRDKVVVMFEEELKRRYPRPLKVVRIEKELFRIGERIFIINAKDTITANIETVLTRYFRRNR